jgi:accessory gene regulator protein AgrB
MRSLLLIAVLLFVLVLSICASANIRSTARGMHHKQKVRCSSCNVIVILLPVFCDGMYNVVL